MWWMCCATLQKLAQFKIFLGVIFLTPVIVYIEIYLCLSKLVKVFNKAVG